MKLAALLPVELPLPPYKPPPPPPPFPLPPFDVELVAGGAALFATTLPPKTFEGVLALETDFAELLYLSRVWLEDGFTTPAMPFLQ